MWAEPRRRAPTDDFVVVSIYKYNVEHATDAFTHVPDHFYCPQPRLHKEIVDFDRCLFFYDFLYLLHLSLHSLA